MSKREPIEIISLNDHKAIIEDYKKKLDPLMGEQLEEVYTATCGSPAVTCGSCKTAGEKEKKVFKYPPPCKVEYRLKEILKRLIENGYIGDDPIESLMAYYDYEGRDPSIRSQKTNWLETYGLFKYYFQLLRNERIVKKGTYAVFFERYCLHKGRSVKSSNVRGANTAKNDPKKEAELKKIVENI